MVKQMQSTGQPTKVVVPSEDGEKRCRIDMETSFSDLMPTRGVEADTSKRRQKYGGGNNSNFGPAAKVNGTLGWVLKTTVERRPDEKEGVDFGFQQGSFPPTLNTKVVTDEALMEEASKSEILGGADLGPLRMIMADGREMKISRLSGLANGIVKERMKDVLERDT
ncbi:hypothetical protein CK203_109628 [Vitis vinifera]|uniref:Uncharacterized protein n=1 Tax=Vitis vinifera TaxID=29760 RepID=A0A438EAQ3_VITVI|nr:hypothetical protein CK203_109628 [Vitis vinifera]